MAADSPPGSAQVGRRRRTASGAPPLWFGIPFVLGGVLLFGFAIASLREETRLADEGVEIAATITDRARHAGTGDDPDTYWITYEFPDPASGIRYVGSASVNRSTYSALTAATSVTVTYLPSDPDTNRIGRAEPQLLAPVMIIVAGGIFGVAGVALLATSWRARSRPQAGALAPVPVPAEMAGPAATTLSTAEGARVDRFTRSPMRVLAELVIAPLAGIGFLAMAAYLVMSIGSNPLLILVAPVAGFFGILLVSGIPALIHRGIGLTLVEVGPDGFRHRDIGRLAWPEIGEVRIEQIVGSGGSEQGLATYQRLGIYPIDPARAARIPGGLTRRLAAAFIRFGNAVARSRGLGRGMTDPTDLAPLGVYAYELEQPFEELVASVRRFAGVVEGRMPSENLAAQQADGGATTMNAGMAALAGPSAESPATPTDRVDVFRRRGFRAADALSIILPGEATTPLPPVVGVIAFAVGGVLFVLVPAAIALTAIASAIQTGALGSAVIPIVLAAVFAGAGILMLRGTRRRWHLATGDDELLTVGPTGLTLRDERLDWAAIASVVGGSGRIEIRRVGQGQGQSPIVLELGMFEADVDEILDSIARFRVVDET